MAPKTDVRTAWARLRQPSATWQRSVLPGLAVIGLVVLGRLLGLFQELEWKTLDSFLRWRPAEAQDKRVLVVGIDEADIQRLGTYPIPDGAMAELLTTLAKQQPRAIGIDIYRNLPQEPGHGTLLDALENLPYVFGIEKISQPIVLPPPSLPPERVGFVDFPLDRDGFVRRAYLGSFPSVDHPNGDEFRFSLALRLAEAYLAEEGLELGNGRRHADNMGFGDTELFQVRPNSGGYRLADAGGNQVLINVRSGRSPFAMVSMAEVVAGRVAPELIRDRVVLIGITSLSVKDLVNSAAVASDNPGLVNGVEMHAHVVSQILGAVLDDRPPLRGWGDGWEYLWIVVWGGVGMVLVHRIPRPAVYMLLIGLIGLGLAGLSFVLLWLGGWWIPVVPTLIVFMVNGFVLPGFYLYDQTLRSRIDERQRVIEQTYDAIHNGPLQTLALLLQKQDTLEPYVSAQLESLNRDLREVYNRLMQESLPQAEQLQLGSEGVVNLRNPLHEVLYEIYTETLRRNFPGLSTIKVHIVKFEPFAVEGLSTDHKQALCRFLEEALCNVGKHAVGATRLTVLCFATESENLIQVEDNGKTVLTLDQPRPQGRGTQQAQSLAQRLGGSFLRSPLEPGTRCELRWSLQPPKRWWTW
ncbi:MAG: CHASE2 domain-containing protein [Nodosilinea sp.]